MAAARPLISVYSADKETEVVSQTPLPAVFTVPVRPDVVHIVHTGMNKNKRQAYAVNKYAGKMCSAESWGTGRAVSRIPRVQGGGTHRAGQGAFGNMCRGGRMFSPTKVWRKWHRKVNVSQRRYATASALAASAIPALVMARGHRIDEISEVPLVISDGLESTAKTSAAVALLKKFAAYDDVEKVKDSKKMRCGKGKMRNRRFTMRRGPLVIYANDNGITRGFRNIPGVEICSVDRLNLLQLSPGGHLGRFCIWSQSAFAKLDETFGTHKKPSAVKSGFKLPYPSMTNPDLTRIINSDEVQSVVKPAKDGSKRAPLKKNPLKNYGVMVRLNPAAASAKRRAVLKQESDLAKKAALVEKKRKGTATVSKDERKAKKAKKAIGKKWSDAALARGLDTETILG